MRILPLLAFLLLLEVIPAHGQAMVYSLAANQAAATNAQVSNAVSDYLSNNPVPTATPLPTSNRMVQPMAYFTDDHPGIEGMLGMPTDNPNYLCVYHLNHWRFSTTTTTIQP